MSYSSTLLCLSTFTISLSLLALSSFTTADDAAVMKELLAALNGVPGGWSTSTDPCKWENVNCDGNNRVTAINLVSKSLSGTLPSNLGSLTQLISLNLQGNSFSGPLPSLANLSSLWELHLGNNNFTSIPDGFFQGLTSLQTLSLSQNTNLAPWSIPTQLTQATSLVRLYASAANVVGPLPDIFDYFPSLKVLRLSFNNLTGPLPKSFGGSGIQILWLDYQENGLSGTIDVLSSMTQLEQVWLHENQFTGPIPDLSKCTSLFDLQLRDNQFTGIVPDSLMSLPSLKNVSLANNELLGPFPVFPSTVTTVTNNGTNSYCKTTSGPCDSQVTILLEVTAALGYPIKLARSWKGNDACVSWSFITCDSQKKITNLNFGKQGFVGTISPAIANLTSLRTLYLNDNNLTGSIPDSLATLPDLQLLDVSNNNLTGPIPKFTSTLRTLYLNDNNLTGSIPDSLATLPDLQLLDVSNNNLTGPIPKFTSTVTFNATGNMLLGKTPGMIAAGKGSHKSRTTIIIVGLLVPFVLIAIFISIYFIVKKRREKQRFQSINPTTTITSTSKAAATPSPSSDSHWDVFLSFRGEDTRKNFVDHLYCAFNRAKISTFRDEKDLQRGVTISTELINAIRGSRIAIVVFSQGYASSTWCLEELVEIVDCRKTRGQTLLPIFYHMDPSDIRKHTGTFAEAFARHEEQFQTSMERVQRWKEALTEAANCAGFNPESIANGRESEFIQTIVEDIMRKLKSPS